MKTYVAEQYPEMQLPCIHSNGNSGSVLGHQYFESLKALGDFKKLFYEIEFHARDYYPLGNEAWLKARAQREVQKANIEALQTYLDAHSGHCFESAR
jgi:hypothetical protein